MGMCSENGRLTMFVIGLETILREGKNTSNSSETCFVPEYGISIVDLAAWRFVGWCSSGVLDGIPQTWVRDWFPLLWAVHVRVDSMPETQSFKQQHGHCYRR